MKKAIVLTYAPVTEKEKELLQKTKVFKIATNFSAAELKPDLRLTADNIVNKCLEADSCPVVSLNYDLDTDRVINAQHLPKRHTSLVSCVDYLLLKGFTHILLVASNPPSATEKLNYDGINSLKNCLYLYKYTKEGNLDIPYKSVKEFLMENLTDEQMILGMKEPVKKLLNVTLFTDATLYEVHTQGRDNKSIENGQLIGCILPFEYQQRLLDGENEIIYNGTVIKKLTKIVPDKKEEVVEDEIVVAKPKPKPKTTTKKKTGKK